MDYLGQLPSLYAIAISSVIGLSIAIYFKYKIKPEIEAVFEKNLDYHIYSIFNQLNHADQIFDIAKERVEEDNSEETINLMKNTASGLFQIKQNISGDDLNYMYLNAGFVHHVTTYITFAAEYLKNMDIYLRKGQNDTRKQQAQNIINYCEKNKKFKRNNSYKIFKKRWKQ